MSSRKLKMSKRQKIRKNISLWLIFTLLFQVVVPPNAGALTGGPSQPEVQSFEPIGTSEMVDPFTGDFTYNIPLLDIDGYPINIVYKAGITMDQEASWVGLGWNINPGVITRGMRGIPDDFKGDEVVKVLNMKPNQTFGLNTGAGIELFGLDKLKVGLNYSLGVRYNNYNGVGIEQGLNLALSAGKDCSSPLNGNLGITSSSDDGLSLNPSIGYSASMGKVGKADTQLGLSVGSSFNGRAGLKTLSVNANVSASAQYKKGAQLSKDAADVATHNQGVSASQGASASFDFGMPTYTPQGGPAMQNFSITGNFKLGFEAYGAHPNFNIGGYYSIQKLRTTTITNPAYGYMYADEGIKFDNSLLDFNREKDGTFAPYTPALPLTNFTYDIFSVVGQGVGGSYRPFRSDMGHVFDPASNTTSDAASTGFEIGLGNLTHFGFDLAVTDVNTKTGRWSNDNPAATYLTNRGSTSNPLYEPFYFKEANEKSVDADPSFFDKAGKSNARSVLLNQLSKFHTVGDHYFAQGGGMASDNFRNTRERRSQLLTMISRADLDSFGLEVKPNLNKLGSDPADAKAHHIAEITTLKTDGTQYVYGLALYIKAQEEVTFSIGTTLNGSPGRSNTADAKSGLVTYQPGDNSSGNQLGIDNYYSNTKMPAYAHSYLLTAILSPDYVDSENDGNNTRGPSAGDIGNFTRFNYGTIIQDYKWRVPIGNYQATMNEGLKSDLTDDKANYIYGEKDLQYLTSIETKNYIAIFSLEKRQDGYGVKNQDGDRATTNPMMLLRKISLYTKPDYQRFKDTGKPATPIKEVHFEYDYSLCPGVPNFYGSDPDKGKLTLRKIYFTYQNSKKARLSPYQFYYTGYDVATNSHTSKLNPGYSLKGCDRWGNYKPNYVDVLDSPTSQNLPNADFPYVEQNQISADSFARVWNLEKISLPSGGIIQVDYESDDYAYVQNIRAGQMFKIISVGTNKLNPAPYTIGTPIPIADKNNYLFFKTQPGITDPERYFEGIDQLYFRFLVDIKGDRYEYVSGYGQILESGIIPNTNFGYVKLRSAQLKDNGGSDVNPITKAAIQFGRLNMPRVVWNSSTLDNAIGDNGSFGLNALNAIVNADFTKNIAQTIQGPNEALYKEGVGVEAIMGKSWIRLNNPNYKKLGGGHRVKKIRISDEWAEMTNNAEQSFSYGQEYEYALEDGTSSGVASYEPQLGGDENLWKQPIFGSEEKLLAPDDEHYMEEPFGESFFPSPNVGYSRVTIKNLLRKNVKHHATGKVVHKFYTTKDYPTITERTDLVARREKSDPLSIQSLLKIDVKDYMTASQGYVIELNDMNGKPMSQEVYQEAQTTPITSVEYHYKSKPYLNGSSRLDSKATVIYQDGSFDSNAAIGVFFDFVADMREHKTTTISGSINGNVDGFIVGVYPVYVPIIIPSFAREKTQFRSAVITKVIQRFGILEETIARDLGSVVSTKNLAYDSETGNVLLTETTTDFNDKVYSLTYPAYWYYDGMGPAYRNIDFEKETVSFDNTGKANMVNAQTYFAEGDELALYKPPGQVYSSKSLGWVSEVTPMSITVINRKGDPVNGSFDLRVIRSGSRNQQEVPMATITTRSNPLAHLKSNIYEEVLQAQAMEYTNQSRTFCDCFHGRGSVTKNPYILGTLGMYKNKKSYLHLTGRTQSNYNSNTNIRRDGVFESYTPFYKLNAGKWETDEKNWTYTSEVTEFSPFGAELENRDALGRFSAAIYGYNQTFPIAVAANARYSQIAFDNFEDYDFSGCADDHFKFRNNMANIDTIFHTGSRSIKVTSGSPVNLIKQLQKCDTIISCDLQIKEIPNGNTVCFVISGGTMPYIFDWTTNGCDVSASISDSGDQICITRLTNGTCEVIISASDKEKCKKLFPKITL